MESDQLEVAVAAKMRRHHSTLALTHTQHTPQEKARKREEHTAESACVPVCWSTKSPEIGFGLALVSWKKRPAT